MAVFSFLLFPLFFGAVFPLGLIQQHLNSPISGGRFTFYGAAGRGACGLDVVSCSAAASGDLFDPEATWVPSTLPDGRYILNDPICQGICVKIDYNGKSGTFPIYNKCPECAEDHVDLSESAFLLLEPLGGTVGIATPATITYVLCNSTTITPCDGSGTASTAAPSASSPSTTAGGATSVPTSTVAPSTNAPAATTGASAVITTTGSASVSTTTQNSSSSNGQVSISVSTSSSWVDGGVQHYQIAYSVQNTGTSNVCGATFKIVKDPATVIDYLWGLLTTDNVNYSLPSYVTLAAGESFTGGANLNGPSVPSFDSVSTAGC